MAFVNKEAMENAAKESNLLQAIEMEIWQYMEKPIDCVKVAMKIVDLVRESDKDKPQQERECSCSCWQCRELHSDEA